MMEFTRFFLRIIYKIQWLPGGICNLPDNQLCASNSKVFVKIYFVNIMRYFRCDHVAYTMMCCSLQRKEYPGIKTNNFNLKILSILQHSSKPFKSYNLIIIMTANKVFGSLIFHNNSEFNTVLGVKYNNTFKPSQVGFTFVVLTRVKFCIHFQVKYF